jgi:hypothetical protein
MKMRYIPLVLLGLVLTSNAMTGRAGTNQPMEKKETESQQVQTERKRKLIARVIRALMERRKKGDPSYGRKHIASSLSRHPRFENLRERRIER